MHNKITLSIAITSIITLNSGMAFAGAPSADPVKPAATEQHGGKCAAGKCGSGKQFEKQEITGCQKGKLIRSRDGKCGTSACKIDGAAPGTTSPQSKITGGVCGQ